MHAIAITNQKGGTGKTTVSLLLAAAAVARGLRVVLVDLDPEGNASFALGLDPTGSAAALLLRREPAATPTGLPGLSVFTGGATLGDQAVRETSPYGLMRRLERYTADFDVAICDCPPQQSMLQRMALIAASAVVLVADAHPLAIRGVQATLSAIEAERADGQVSAQRVGVVFNRTDSRRLLDRTIPEEAMACFPGIPQFRLRQHAPLAQAMATGSTADLLRAAVHFEDAGPLIAWLGLPEGRT